MVVNKPKGMTSHDVVDKLRRITGVKKIGHGGTLDPNATGVMIIGIGRAYTKQLGKITKDVTKTYTAEITLGEERDTDDIEGRVVKQSKTIPSKEEVEAVVNKFVGDIEQMPPQYSAIKVKGKKAYDVARKGGTTKLEPRKVTIHEIGTIHYEYPRIEFDVIVSAGTYIRSLARDIGRELGCYGYLNNLVRICVGNYSVNEASPLSIITPENWHDHERDLEF